jgi:hypothetical protein
MSHLSIAFRDSDLIQLEELGSDVRRARGSTSGANWFDRASGSSLRSLITGRVLHAIKSMW